MADHKLQHRQKENNSRINSAPRNQETDKRLEKSYKNPFSTVPGGFSPPETQLTPANIQFLQRTIGNQAVNRIIQAKLKIGQPGDKYEQEADMVADRVMRTPEPRVQRQSDEEAEESVQAKLEDEEEKEESVQRQAEKGEEELQTKPVAGQVAPMIQKQADEEDEPLQAHTIAKQPPGKANDLQASIQSSKGGGQALPESSRVFFERRFGKDFSQVKMHTGSRAAKLAKALNAQAFTQGNDIYFGAGKYQPGTPSGDRLLGHELTHVIQQKSPPAKASDSPSISRFSGAPGSLQKKVLGDAGTKPAAEPTDGCSLRS